MNEDCLDQQLHKTAQPVHFTTPGGTIHMDNNVHGAPRVARMGTMGLEHLLHFEPLTVVLTTSLPPSPSQLALTSILPCAGSG